MRIIKEVVVLMGLLALLAGVFGKKPGPAAPTADPDPTVEDNGLRGTEGLGDKAVENDSGLTYFYYAYQGSIGGGDYHCEAERQADGTALIRYESMEYRDYGELTLTLPQEFFGKLEALYHDCRLYRWEGFSMTDTYVLDGDGFSLSLMFVDGKRMSADGTNAYPEGYREFTSAMRSLFDPVIEEMKEAARQKRIAEGVRGKLDFVMINFKQQGASGRDSADALLAASGIRNKNCDITVKCQSGEIFGKGERRVYAEVPEDILHLEEIQKLIEKYNVISWYNWEKSAENYSDCEWFQLDLSYDSGDAIRCMGTLHPENYDAFRAELLALLADTLTKAEALSQGK